MAEVPPSIPEGTVTILSTDLVGSTALNQRLGDRDAAAIEREVEALAIEQVGKQNGIVFKDTGDGLMVAFQSARRAVACAQEIQRALARRNRSQAERAAELRIGLHTGEVLAEDGGIQGETILVAKRVEENALPGTIFASDTVYGVLGTARSELEDRGDFELKGIALPWQLFEVPWADAAAGGVLPSRERTPYVGRVRERSQLVQAVERARGGEGSLILVGGEAGVGKSRIVAEAAEEARRQGLQVLTGQSPDQQGAPPYLPWIEQIEEAARQIDATRMRLALGESAPQIAVLMPELRVRYPDIPEPAALPPEQQRRFVLNAFSEFVERSARATPLCLVFEDLHWADESSVLLLQHVCQRLAQMPVLLVATYRHEELAGSPLAHALPQFLRSPAAEELLLTRLSEQDVAKLLEGRAGREPPSELVQLVYSETEGNPFFVEEVFRHLHDAGKLFDEQGSWLSGVAIADTEVPRGVSLVIAQRLERVSEECRRMLTLAALAGKGFRFDLLASVDGIEEDPLLDALEEAMAATLVEDVSTQREAHYQFVHEQIRQTLLSLLSTARRQRMHLRVADAHEKLHGAQAETHAAEISHHLYRAGGAADPDRTAHWLELASRRSIDALGFEQALRDLDAARAVLRAASAARETGILRLRARALRGLGRIEEALAAFHEALEMAPEATERDAVLADRAQLRVDLFRGAEALEDLEPLLERTRGAGERARELELMLMRSRAFYILSLDQPGYAERVRDSYAESYALAKELGDRRGMARALIPTSWFVDYWGDYRPQALENNSEATAIADALGDEELQIEAATSRLRLLLPSDSAEAALEIRDRLKARRDPLRLKEHYFWLMWHHWIRAEFPACIEACDAGIALASQLGIPPVQYPSIRALALADMGRFDESWASLEQEVTDAEHPFGRCMQLLAEALWLERVGALERAGATAKQVLDEAARLSRTWMQSFMIDLLTRICARQGAGSEDLRDWIAAKSDETGFHATSLPAAELMLSLGRKQEALAEASRTAEAGGRNGFERGRMVARDLELRALAALERWDEILERAEAAQAEARASGFYSLLPSLLSTCARARTATGDEAGAARDRAAATELCARLAGSIRDPGLRAAFEKQACPP